MAASANMARERSPGLEIEAKADGDCKLVLGAGVCAELETEAISAAQHSKVGSDTGRIMPGPSIAITTFPSGKKFIPNARFAVERFGWRQIGRKAFFAPGSRPGAGVRPCRRWLKSQMPAIGSVGRLATPQKAREPIGPEAIVVDDKVANIVTFALALGRTDAGGPAPKFQAGMV